MVHRRNPLARILITILTTAVMSAISMLVLSPAASARVSVVPDAGQGGETRTFAIRMANDRSALPSTRLELTFPTDVEIPNAEVTPAAGWSAKVNMRSDKAVGSIVWTGGKVPQNQFAQFLVTMGPLPADGKLVFAVAQEYENGDVERWTDPASKAGAAGAPTITVVPAAKAGTLIAPVGGNPGAPVVETTGWGLLTWLLVAAGLLALAVGALVGYRALGRPKSAARHSAVDADLDMDADPAPERAGMR